MHLDEALEIVNDTSLIAYCDYVHQTVFQTLGEYEMGVDDSYDQVAYALAFVAVELVLNEESLQYVSGEECSDSGDSLDHLT